MQFVRRALVAMSVVGLAVSAHAATRSRVTDYCLVEPLEASAGGKAVKLGDYVMKARLAVSGSHYVLKAWNEMPDSSQVLAFEADGTFQSKGPTRFRFIDNFANRGRGSFTASKSEMRIEIERVRTAPGGENVGRNYGRNTLFRRGCKWEEPS